MSKAAELIAGLSPAAQFDSDGGFSLDRDKAREKMRQFQLADPHRYVLLLVEAAVLRGATTIRFEIDGDDMRMQFDAGLEWEDLDELYTSLFVSRSTVEIRARRELALAANAVMALNPRYCAIESVNGGDGGGGERVGLRAWLRPDTPDEIERFDPPASLAAPDPAWSTWTQIHVKERFRPGLLVRFLRASQGELPETALLERRCAHASVAIELDGRQISHGLPGDLLAGVRFETDALRGVAGIVSDEARRRRSVIVLMSNGIEISTHEINDSVGGLWFWVDGSRFRKDVSQADVVRSDPAYEAMLAAAAEARDRVLARLVGMWASGTQFSEDTRPTQAQIFDLLRGCFLRWADPSWLLPNAGPLGRLAEIPVWQMLDGRWASARELSESLAPGRAPLYSTWAADVAPIDWEPAIVITGGELELEAVARVYPEAVDATARLRLEVPWELARRRWRGRPHPIELPRGLVSPAHVVRYHEGQGEDEHRGVAALSHGGRSNVRVIVEGATLTELELELGVGPLELSAVVTGPLTPSKDYQRPLRDRAYAQAVLLLLGQFPALLASWAAVEGASTQSCLLALTRPAFASEWLEAFGFEAEAAARFVDLLGEPTLVAPLEFDPDGAPTRAVARSLRFNTVDGRRVDLVEIEAARASAEHRRVRYVHRWADSCAANPELLVWLDEHELRLLEALFGAEALADETSTYLRERQHRAFRAKPARSPSRPSTTWSVAIDVDIDGEHVVGHVGISASAVRAWSSDQPRRAAIEVYSQSRQLCTVQVSTWIPGVEAALAWEGAPINDSYDGVRSTRPLQRAIDHGLVELLRGRAAEAEGRRPGEDERRLLWMGIVSPFVCAELFAAWRALRSIYAEAPDEARAHYFELMQLYPGVPLADLRASISLLLDEGLSPTAAGVLDALGREPAQTARGREFHGLILASFAELEQVPLVETAAGESISLAGLVSSYAETGELAYVDRAGLSWGGERLIFRADPLDHVALIRLFGPGAFKEVSDWIRTQSHQLEFEAQAQLDALKVDDRERLVGVEFERDGLRGELAIPPWVPGDSGEIRLTMCHERRVVDTIMIHGAMPVIGLIDDDQAELSDDYRELETNGSRMAMVRRVVGELVREQLLPALADAYAEFGPQQRSIARTWMFSHWRVQSPRAGRHPNRLTEAGRRFADLALFCDVDDQARTLHELIARYDAHDAQLWYVERHPGHSVEPPFAIVKAHGEVLAVLEALFPQLSDFGARWAARVSGAQTKRSAPALPSPAQTEAETRGALVELALDRHDLQGRVWLPASHPVAGGVVVGSDGRVVETIAPVEWLPARGVVRAGLEIDDRFEAAQLTGSQRRFMSARVISLYSQLLGEHRGDLERPDRPAFMESEVVRARQLRIAILRDAALSLARARVAGEGFDAILSNLDKRLRQQPLLRMNTGRMVSVELARELRPLEFGHLGIWDPNLPPVDPSDRARLLLGEGLEPPPTTPEPPVAEPVREPITASDMLDNLFDDEPDPDDPAPEPERDAPASDDEPPLTQPSDAMPADSILDTPAPETPAPETPAPETPPTTEERIAGLLERIRGELRVLRDQHEVVLSEGLLDRVDAEPRTGKMLVAIDDGVLFDSTHPRFIRAMDDPDPIWVSFLASTAYTAINTWQERITDAHEIAFHRSHAEFVLSALID